MRIATLFVLLGVLTLAAAPVSAGLPEGKIAVVRVTAIDGLAKAPGAVTETRTTAFTYDGIRYAINNPALTGLDGVETLVLIDRRRDTASEAGVVRAYSQEVRAVTGTYFEVKDIPNRTFAYQVASVAGNLRLTGDGDQILCSSGDHGPYHVWKVTSIDVVDRDSIRLN